MHKFRLRPRRINLPVGGRKLVHMLWKTWLCWQSKYSGGGMWDRHHLMFSLREIFWLEMKTCLACNLYRWDFRVVLMMRLCEECCLCFWGIDSLSYWFDRLCWRCLNILSLHFRMSFYYLSFSLVMSLNFFLSLPYLFILLLLGLLGWLSFHNIFVGVTHSVGWGLLLECAYFLSYCRYLCCVIVCVGSLLLSVFLYIIFLLVILLLFLFAIFVFRFSYITLYAGWRACFWIISIALFFLQP